MLIVYLYASPVLAFMQVSMCCIFAFLVYLPAATPATDMRCWPCRCGATLETLPGNGSPARVIVITIRVGPDRLLFSSLWCWLVRLLRTFLSCRAHFIGLGLHAFEPLHAFPVCCIGWRRLYLDLFHGDGIWRWFIREDDLPLRVG